MNKMYFLGPFMDRTDLVNTTLHTVSHTLFEGMLLVVLVLILFLGSWRGALLVAVTIPLSLLIAFILMKITDIPANLLSLGAIDFGILVDGAIVMMETILKGRESRPDVELSKDGVVRRATEVARPILFSTLIIITAYLPLFAFEHIEQKMFTPMAYTVGYALLVLFFVMGIVKTCGSFAEMKKPELAFKCFIRFALAQAAVTWGMELMTGAFRVAQGMVTTIIDSSGLTAMSATALPDEMASIIEDVGFIDSIPLWAVTLLGSLFIWVLSLVMILTVYSRFFKLYIATAIAPVPLASFAGQPSSSIGVAFLKSYAAICLEGCVIVLACVIFSAFASSPPAIADDTLAAATIVWNYVGELIFNMLVLVGAIKMSDRIIRELMGLG